MENCTAECLFSQLTTPYGGGIGNRFYSGSKSSRLFETHTVSVEFYLYDRKPGQAVSDRTPYSVGFGVG